MIDEIICGDCLEVMAGMGDNSVDLVIADPPYNISQPNSDIDRSSLGHKSYRRSSPMKRDFGEWDHFTDENYADFISNYFREVKRVSKEGAWIYTFFDKLRLGLLESCYEKYDLKFRTIITWCKSNPMPTIRKVNWVSATELISVSSNGNGGLKNFIMPQSEMFNYIRTPNKSIYGKTIHPTEKPEGIIEKFISVSSNEGDLVLDPFLGSGTTAVACVNLDRHYIGIELSEEYCSIARQRVEDAKMFKYSQPELF